MKYYDSDGSRHWRASERMGAGLCVSSFAIARVAAGSVSGEVACRRPRWIAKFFDAAKNFVLYIAHANFHRKMHSLPTPLEPARQEETTTVPRVSFDPLGPAAREAHLARATSHGARQ